MCSNTQIIIINNDALVNGDMRSTKDHRINNILCFARPENFVIVLNKNHQNDAFTIVYTIIYLFFPK